MLRAALAVHNQDVPDGMLPDDPTLTQIRSAAQHDLERAKAALLSSEQLLRFWMSESALEMRLEAATSDNKPSGDHARSAASASHKDDSEPSDDAESAIGRQRAQTLVALGMYNSNKVNLSHGSRRVQQRSGAANRTRGGLAPCGEGE